MQLDDSQRGFKMLVQNPRNLCPTKSILITKQITLILHSQKCNQPSYSNCGNNLECKFPYCRQMKRVLGHVSTCRIDENCPVPYCSSSKETLAHWKMCVDGGCPVCMPIKNKYKTSLKTTWPVQTTREPTIRMKPDIENKTSIRAQKEDNFLDKRVQSLKEQNRSRQWPQNLIIHQREQNNCPKNQREENALPVPWTYAWQLTVSYHTRNHLIQKLKQTFLNSKGKRKDKLVNYARDFEREMFDIATSRYEYFLYITKKIFMVENKLDGKCRVMKNKQRHNIYCIP